MCEQLYIYIYEKNFEVLTFIIEAVNKSYRNLRAVEDPLMSFRGKLI